MLADYEKDGRIGFSTLVTSANPHDGSSAHSNIAVRVDSHIWQDVLKTEAAVVTFSGGNFVYPNAELFDKVSNEPTGTVLTQILTEGKIHERALKEINATTESDTINLLMFYFADRDIVKALRAADQRGVQIRLLLDPNKDAFGREKNGSPNRQVAHELVSNSSGNTTVRWCDTHGEQCHSKLLLIERTEQTILLQGSANYTKRNLHNYNLETNVIITGSPNEQIFTDSTTFFDTQWNNENGVFYSTDYATYQNKSRYQTISYKLKEFTGLSHW